MGDIGVGVITVGAEVHIGIAAMKNVLMEVVGIVEDMMTMIEIITVRVIGGTELLALAIRGDGAVAEAMMRGGAGVRLGKVVKRDVLGLSNGTGKKNWQSRLIRLLMLTITLEAIVGQTEMNTIKNQ